MQLAQKGLIDIDAPIQQYIREFSIKYHTASRQPITIRSIMSHQYGIFEDKEANWDDTAYPAEDFRNYPEFAKNEYAAYHPNYITAYSNFAVSLLGLIIERVSHQKYEKYVYDNILKPCGMVESGFDPKKDNEQLLAKGYDSDGNLYPFYYIACNPVGFLASNSNNMAKFIKMILNNGFYNKNWILYPNTLNYMYKPQSTYCPMNLYDKYTSPYNFGLSWVLENRSFDYIGDVVGHSGNLPPYNSNLLIAKDKDIGVFVTANKADFYPNEISYFALVQAVKIFRNLNKPDLPVVPNIVNLPEYQKKFYTGTYCNLHSNPIEIYSENDTLYWQELHSERIPLVYHADGWFSFLLNNEVVPGTRLTIKCIDGQKVLCIEGRDSFLIYGMVYGNKIIPKDTLSSELLKITGLYMELSSGYPALILYPDTLSQSKAVFLSATYLVDNTQYVLNPEKDGTLVIQGLGRSAQETMYFTKDTLNYSGYKFVKFNEMQSKQKLAVSKVTALKSAEAVISGLKKSIGKYKNF